MFRLRIEGGTRNGEAISLTPGKTLLLGRGREAELRFPEDATMSRIQAELTWDGAAWTLVNKSQHGSLVNGQRVDTSRVLVPGDQLVLGGTHVTYEPDPTPGSAPAPIPPEMPATAGTPQPMPRDLAPDAAPGAASPAPAPGDKPAAAPKKAGGSKALIIIAVIGLLFSCCCLSGVGVWYFKYKKPSSSTPTPPK